jgi:DNA-binding response OmpR family regulator
MSQIPRLFIVDDDPMLASMLKDHIDENMEAEVTLFPTGEACLKVLKRQSPDLIILDYHLNSKEKTAKNGLDILKEIRSRSKTLPVVMLSSQESYTTAAQTIGHGAIHYVIKGKNAFDEVLGVVQANV